MSNIVKGYGKQSPNNWGYMSGLRGLHVQTSNITDASSVADGAILDTTIGIGESETEIGRGQDLLIVAILQSGTLAGDAKIALWLEVTLGGELNSFTDSSSSNSLNSPSDPDSTLSYPQASTWALLKLEGPVVTGASYKVDNKSIAYMFTDLPAGRYKAAVYTGLGSGSKVIIAERHSS